MLLCLSHVVEGRVYGFESRTERCTVSQWVSVPEAWVGAQILYHVCECLMDLHLSLIHI